MRLQPHLIADALRERGLDAWLIADFRGGNPIFSRVVGGGRFSTRRAYLIYNRDCHATLVHSTIDQSAYADLTCEKRTYVGYGQMDGHLRDLLSGKRVAVDWSPGGEVPHVDYLPHGAAQRLTNLGAELREASGLVMDLLAAWSDEAFASHQRAMRACEDAMTMALDLVRARYGSITEFEVQTAISERLEGAGFDMGHPAIVGTGPHAGDPHYSPSADRPVVIGPTLLIDLWGREIHDDGTFADITWIGCHGDPSPEYARAAQTVFEARDRSLRLVRERWEAHQEVQGWELDRAAADHIIAQGYEADIRTRTGHSLSPGEHIHGIGMHLDDLETHDVRPMAPRAGFTIEPGIYRSDFGVRSEINVWVHPETGPHSTGTVQTELVRY